MNTETTAGPRLVRAPRGTELSCKGWQQEAALRMLMNNLDPEVAERPDDLIVYGGTGKAARNWDCFDAIVRTLRTPRGRRDAARPVAASPSASSDTHEMAPRVLIANSNLVGRLGQLGRVPPPRSARPHHVRPDDRRLVDLHRHAGHPAGHLRDLRRRGPEALRRRRWPASWSLTAGLGGMGGAQPLAVTMNGGVASCVEVDPHRIERRLETALRRRSPPTPRRGAQRWPTRPTAARKPLSIGLLGNAADVYPELVRRGITPDLVTDQTIGHDPLNGYVPDGMTLDEALALRARRSRRTTCAAPCASMGAHVEAMLELQRRGADIFDYGNNIRGAGEGGRLRGRLRHPRLRARLHPPALLRRQRARSAGWRSPATRRTSPSPTTPLLEAVPATTQTSPAGSSWRGEHRLPGPARAHLLARLRRARQGRPRLQRPGAHRQGQGAHRHRPRPPRLRLRRLARTARPRA